MSNFMTDIISRVENVGQGFSETAYSALGDQVLQASRYAMIIYIWHYCCLAYIGRANIDLKDLLGKLARMLIILALVGNWSYFDYYIYRILMDVPENVGRVVLQAISGVSSAEPTSGLMQIWNTANKVSETISAQSGYFTIMPNLIAFVVWLIILAFAGLSLAVIILAKMITWVLVAVAPVFIACFLFGISRPLARGWASQVLLYSIMPLFTYVVIAIVIAMILPTLDTLNEQAQTMQISWAQVGSFCIAACAGLFIILKIAVLTQGIVGAMAIGIGDVVGAMAATTGTSSLAAASGISNNGRRAASAAYQAGRARIGAIGAKKYAAADNKSNKETK